MRADLVYMDLGMSSMQVDTRERGFAYAYDAPLDMRMDPDQELTAAEIVNTWDRRRIARALREYGEERFADRIAGEIVRRRARQELTTTFELNEAITAAIPAPARFAGGHPAKRTFQAIRIAVNGELQQLDEALPLALGRREDRRPRRRAHLPLARGPPRQALLRREGPRLHLPARPARLRVRQHARGGARAPPLDRAHAGRGRGEPPIEVGSPPGRPQAQGGALVMPEHAAVRTRTAPIHPRRVSGPVAPPGRRPARAVRGRTGAFERISPDPGPPGRRPRAAQPRLHLADRDPARRDRGHAGLAAAPELGHRRARADPEHARAVRTWRCRAQIAELTSGERVRDAAAGGQMVDPPAGETRYLTARREAIPRARRGMQAAERGARTWSWPTTAFAPGLGATVATLLAGRRAGDDGGAQVTRARGHAHRRRGRDRARAAAHARRPRPTPVATAVPTARPRSDPATGRRHGAAGLGACSSSSGASVSSSPSSCSRSRSARPRPPGSAWSRRTRSSAPPSVQQEADIDDPGRRGSITDVNGIDLGGLRARGGHRRDAVPDQGRDEGRGRARPDDRRRARTTLLRKLARRDTRFVYLGRGIPADKADKAQKLKIPGLEFIPRYRRDYPRDWTASQLLGSVGTDGKGLGGLEYSLDKQLTRHRRRAPAGQGRDGRADRDARHQAGPARPERHASRSTPTSRTGPSRCSAEVGKTWKPKGATAIVMDPNSGAILALANWPRVNANALEERAGLRAPEPRDRRELRARLDLQGVHRRRRAGGRQGHAGHEVQHPAGPQVADREIKDAEDHGYGTMTVSEILKYSSNIGAVLIAPAASSGQAVRRVDPQVGLRQADRRRPAGRGDRARAPAQASTRARPWATCRSARASRSRRCRWWPPTPRSPTAASCARRTSSTSVGGKKTKTPPGQRVISEATAASVRKMLEGVLGPGGTASGAEIKGYTLAGKTGTAEKAINGEYSKDKYVASFVGFAPAKQPEAARRGDRRRAQGRDLRRPGRRAGLEARSSTSPSAT